MATDAITAVSAERYAEGLTYEEFLEQAKVNLDQFARWHDSFSISSAHAESLRRLKARGVARMLALGEDWCPDVYRGLPVFKRISEITGMELRVFPRDKNLDIMDLFLNQGQFRSIPTVVFYTQDMQYLGHFIERPALANRERAEIEAEVRAAMPGAPDNEVRKVVRERSQARWNAWQDATVQEVVDLLQKRLGAE